MSDINSTPPQVLSIGRDESTEGGFPHFESYLPAGDDNKAATIWPQAHSRLNSFFDTRCIADEKLRPTGTILPDAFARWWVRRWQSAFRNRTSITDDADVLAYCELGRELDRLFNLTTLSGNPFGFDAEFTFYDQPFSRGTEQGQSCLYPFADYGHALEETENLTPQRFPFFSAELPHLNSILYPRMGCKEFFEWTGFLAQPDLLTAEQLDDLGHVGCSEVGINGWCRRVSTETCGQFAEKFIEQLRNAIVRVSPWPITIPPNLLFRDALTEVVRWVDQAVELDRESERSEAEMSKQHVEPKPASDAKADAGAPPGDVPKPSRKGKNIDARMLKVMADNCESVGWSKRIWAERLDCTHSTIGGSRTWKGPLKTAKALLNADSHHNSNRTPKSSRKPHRSSQD